MNNSDYPLDPDPYFSLRSDHSAVRNHTDNYDDDNNNNNNTKKNNDKIIHLNHLVNFSMYNRNGVKDIEDGINKLRKTERWLNKLECFVEITDKKIICYNANRKDKLEEYHLQNIDNITPVISHPNDEYLYNNVILFTIHSDDQKQQDDLVVNELAIFQCIDDNYSAITVARLLQTAKNHFIRSTINNQIERQEIKSNDNKSKVKNQVMLFEDVKEKSENYIIGQTHEQFRRSIRQYQKSSSSRTRKLNSNNYDDDDDDILRNFDLLNSAFDNIEEFIYKLQRAAEAHKKGGRFKSQEFYRLSQPPTVKEFETIFKNFKICFNLLAKLETHIYNPNSSDLLHYLFTPLNLIVQASKDHTQQQQPIIARKVFEPLLTEQAFQLLDTSINEQERLLLNSLGHAWNKIKNDNENSFGKSNNNNNNQTFEKKLDKMDINENKSKPPFQKPTQNQSHSIKFQDTNKKFYQQLITENADVAQTQFSRTGTNQKELTVQNHEYLKVLDFSKKWWKVINMQGSIGFVPHTILKVINGCEDNNKNKD